jgi:hypothetical protein
LGWYGVGVVKRYRGRDKDRDREKYKNEISKQQLYATYVFKGFKAHHFLVA